MTKILDVQASRRAVLAGAGGMSLMALLAACAPGSLTSGDSAGQVKFWQVFNSKEAEAWFRENFVEAYNATTPKVPVNLIVKQLDTIAQQTQTALAAGSGPDIVGTAGPALVSEYVDAGYLAPLDEFATTFGWNDRLLPWALETGKIGGVLYSLPTGYETMINLYNRAYFEAKGYVLPTNRADFEALCEEAAGAGLVPIASGNADWVGVSEWLATIVFNHFSGPEAFRQALTGEISFTDPVFVDGFQLFLDYFAKGWIGGGVDRYFTNTFADQYTAVATGKSLFHWTGSWATVDAPSYFGSEAGNDGEWDWGAYPSLREGVPAEVWELSIGGTLSVNAKAGSVEGAAAFLDYLNSDPKKQGQGVAEAGLAPAAIEVAVSDFPSSVDERVSRIYQTISEAQVAGYTTWTFLPATTDSYVIEGWDKMLTGDLAPADYAAGIDSEYRKAVADGFVPPLPA
ncbi:MAG: extracellular solute-binding protein [Protaetiibacter sp.]